LRSIYHLKGFIGGIGTAINRFDDEADLDKAGTAVDMTGILHIVILNTILIHIPRPAGDWRSRRGNRGGIQEINRLT